MKVDKSKWEVKKLGEVCSFFTDGNWIESKDQSNIGVRLIQTGNIGIGVYKDKSGKEHFITEETFKRLDCTEVKEGDCLISRLPDPIGRSCIIPKIKTKCITAVDCSIIRFSPFYIPNFFILYTQSNSYKIRIQKKVNGTTRKRISRSNLSEILVPVPPLPEQQSIALELDAIQSLITKYKEQLNDYDNLAKSIFNEMFGDVVSNDKGWERKKLGDVCLVIRGPFGGSLKKECFVEKGYAVYEQQNAIYNRYTFRYFIDDVKFQELKRFSVSPGDIIMSCAGTMGKVSIVPSNAPKGIINQALMKFTLSDVINSIYLIYLLSSVLIQDGINNQAKGVAMKNIAAVGTIKNQLIPLPPLPLQQAFAARITAIESQKDQVKQQITDLQMLFDSRMQYYFD